MTSPVVELENAGFELGGHRLVGPLDLIVRCGETVVLLGESGSGKTTTLRLVNRLLDPTEGEIRVEGTSTANWNPVHLRRRIGYMIQEVGLLPHLTVEGNVELVPLLQGWPVQRRKERVAELLALVGLPPEQFSHRRPQGLSGGQRQRVGVARALAADPPILLCDEAFGAVDPVTRAALQKEFRSLIQQLEKTVVFVTHDVREALALADRIVVLEHGRSSFVGTVAEFQRNETSSVRVLRELA
ncbi:MAG: ABC transporter ATP-binding protein [Gemmatimonas sp. SG8_17]|nr:MAG: ABC transporter ATP-binding protein [Gemmatimonas sp. SG8_17]